MAGRYEGFEADARAAPTPPTGRLLRALWAGLLGWICYRPERGGRPAAPGSERSVQSGAAPGKPRGRRRMPRSALKAGHSRADGQPHRSDMQHRKDKSRL